MKPEAEIRKHLDDLKRLLVAPCDCEGVARLACAARRRDIALMALLLSWVLERNPEYDRAVEVLSHEAAQL